MLLFFLLPITPRLTDVTDLCFWRLMLTFLIDLCGSPGLPILNLQEVVNILGIFLTSLIFSAYILFVFVWCWLLTAKAKLKIRIQMSALSLLLHFFLLLFARFEVRKLILLLKINQVNVIFNIFIHSRFFLLSSHLSFQSFSAFAKIKMKQHYVDTNWITLFKRGSPELPYIVLNSELFSA